MSELHLYGIPNCDTVRKARRWLQEHDRDHVFHDFKKEPPDLALLQRWAKAIGWEVLLNRRGTTWRKLSDEDRDGVDEARALRLMQEHPSLIKRPVVCTGDKVVVGFSEAVFTSLP